MKKRKNQANTYNRIYGISPNPIPATNQLKLKQIYDTSYRVRDKDITNRDKSPSPSPRISSLKKQALARYQIQPADNKPDLNISMNKTNRYRAYLESEVIPKMKHNRRYSKKIQREDEDRSYLVGAVTSRAGRNDSVDMFKIRKGKISSSHKVSASSYTRLQQTPNTFQLALTLYKQSKFAQALQTIEPCLQKQPKNPEYQYYTAIISLNLHNYVRGLELLEKVCRDQPQYKKTAYLFAAISAKNLREFDRAYKLCTMGLEKFANYKELILYRANIATLMGNYQLANQDYQSVLKSEKNNIDVLLKNAECLSKMGAYANCLSNLSNALYLDKPQYKQQILTKRIQIYLNPKSYNLKQAKKDLSKLTNLSASPTLNPKIKYLKGIILASQGLRKQSLLCFEQCLKQGSSKQIMAKALVQIVKNKIDDRDFYSACYHVNRSKYMEIGGDEIEIYRLFSEGVVHLMKRKVADGDRNFTALEEKYPQLTPYLTKIFYFYKAFAKFSLSKYQQAIQSYDQANKQTGLDIFSKYNKQLAQGIVEINNKNYQKGFQFFNTAQKTIVCANLNKIQPFLYRGAAHIQLAKDLINSHNDIQQLKSLQQIFSGLKELDKAYDINDANSNMLYYRGLVYLYLGKYDQALQDIVKAISKSQENVAKYFFFRAITHNSLNNKKQALNDFNICNNLDEKFPMLYLQRAKLHFSNQNVTKGLEDLIKLKNLGINQDIKFHQACLNYFYGHYAMANACCDQIADQQKARQIKLLIKTKMGKLKQAKKILKSKADTMIFQILQSKPQIEQVPSTDLQFFTLYHYHHYMAVKYFRQGQYSKAVDMFVMASKERNLYDLEQGIANNNLSEDRENGDEDEDNGEGADTDTINRINYNVFLSYLMLREWKKGYEVFIRDVIGVKEQFLKNQFIASFSHLLFQAMKQSKHTLKRQQKQVYQLNLYDSKLERVLPDLTIQLPNFIMKTRLCLLAPSSPKLEQCYRTKANPDFILEYMKMSQIENRPEPPWVKREESGLIFTDQIQNINIQFQTTENEEEEEQEDGEEGEEAEEGEEGEEGEEEGEAEYEEDEEDGRRDKKSGGDKMSVRKFKEKMKLDDSIQRKLQKIMERKQKNN